jgi:amidase
MVDVTTATASQLVASLRDGSVSSSELLAAHVAQMERWNPRINAVVATALERAQTEARAADDARARGESRGALQGLPMTIKDSFETEGLTTACGAPELASHVPTSDADPVARLRAAGAIVFGKTNLPLYAGDWQSYNEVYGRTNNPWDLERVPGGSSGGSAASVATGISALELGSDIGGSIRVPAHFCGVFGHKPTHGAVPDRGHIPGPPGTMSSPDLAVSGPIGRSVDDLELALDALIAGGLGAAPGTLPPAAGNAGLRPRVVIHLEDENGPVSAESRIVLENAAKALEGAGAEIVDAPVPPLGETHRLYTRLLNAVMGAGLPPRLLAEMATAAADPGHPMHEQASDFVLSHREWLSANERRHKLRHRWHTDVFSVADVVLAPIAGVPAFLHDTETPFPARVLEFDGGTRGYADVMLPWPGFATLPGLPATAVPVGRTTSGLPVGAQLVGPMWGDRTCLAAARLLERATGGFTPPPF